jgi:hypothetical protein
MMRKVSDLNDECQERRKWKREDGKGKMEREMENGKW